MDSDADSDMEFDMDFEMYRITLKLKNLHIRYEPRTPSKHRIAKDIRFYRYTSVLPIYSDESINYVYKTSVSRTKYVEEKRSSLPNSIIEMCIDASPMRAFKKDIFSGWKNIPTPFPVSSITNFAMAKWAVEKGLPRAPCVAKIIARHGHADVLRHLYVQDFPIEWPECIAEALMNGHMHLADWLAHIELFKTEDEEENKEKMRDLARELSYEGHVVPALNWIMNSGYYIDVEGITEGALLSCSDASLQWLHSNFDVDVENFTWFLSKAFSDYDCGQIAWLYWVGWITEVDVLTYAEAYHRNDVQTWAMRQGMDIE